MQFPRAPIRRWPRRQAVVPDDDGDHQAGVTQAGVHKMVYWRVCDRMKSGSHMIVYLHAFALVVTVTTFWKSR